MIDNTLQDYTSDPTTARIESHLELGQNLLSNHAPEKAIEQFRAGLSLDPDHAELHAWLALALAEAERFDAAAHEADLAIAQEPGNSFFLFVKGLVLSSASRWKEAQPFLQEAVALAPEVAQYHAHLAQVYYHQEKKSECESAARNALALDPEEETALLYLGFVQLDANRLAEAKPLLERALQIDPDSTDAHNALGVYYLHARKNDEALHHIQEALRINPENQTAQQNLVQAMGAKNKFYGLFWQWSLFLSRFSSSGQIAVILGAWVLMQILRGVGRAYPSLQPVVVAVGIFYLFFCIYTWTAPAIFRWWLRRTQPF